ncbi:MAG: hypothetical protein HPY57_13165 [Ignavibacteria bacterium]|nr:hypothetical protein [Ignavibacteria bacterium]
MIFISDTNLHENLNVNTIDFIDYTQFAVLETANEKHEGTLKLADPGGNCVIFPPGFRLIAAVTKLQLLNGAIVCY